MRTSLKFSSGKEAVSALLRTGAIGAVMSVRTQQGLKALISATIEGRQLSDYVSSCTAIALEYSRSR